MVEKEGTRALVLLSGGIDSATCLMLAIQDNKDVVAISIDYNQRHKKEIKHAQAICNRLDVEHRTWAMTLPESMLTAGSSEVIPDASYADLPSGVSPTYVPFRNGNFLSTMASIAHAEHFDVIYFGAHAEDAHNWVYPDCTPEFIGAMANAIYIGTYHEVRLRAPLTYMSKADVVFLGMSLGVPFDLTWSCYSDEDLHCGRCPTCRARKAAFSHACVNDPTIYASTAR